ncbi:uncharacterized protein LOC143184708 isoform X2 [Calliopsis andreniformis]|uniref:uncharacterized protein LOC143184708 isoform X2 n=1 Tax=Calliopsis andreniformis TaxID=337506 RepID=UPI003FCD1FE3
MATKIRMERIQGDLGPQLAKPSNSAANLIEWNVDMNVTVSNVKKSKVYQRSRRIVLFLLVLVLAIELSHLRKKVCALQVQIQSANTNLLLLMSKYEKLNRSLNRVLIQRTDRLLENKNAQDVKRLLVGASSMSRVIEILEDMRNTTNKGSLAYKSLVPYFNQIKNFTDKYSLISDSVRAKENYTMNFREALVEELKHESVDDENENNPRIERAVLTMEKQNMTENQDVVTSRGTVASYNDTDDMYDDNDLDIWREPRSGRSRRDEGRGPLVATFVGAIPEQHVTDTVYIGPWVKSAKNNTQYSLNKFHLVENKKSIEVTATGLYMISAQVMDLGLCFLLKHCTCIFTIFLFQIFYFGEPTNYSYWILLSSEGKSTTQKLVKCSTASSTSASEVSCYTSIITPLQKGDRVHIQQQERDRLINMREGHSYIQLVLLSNNIRKRRLK